MDMMGGSVRGSALGVGAVKVADGKEKEKEKEGKETTKGGGGGGSNPSSPTGAAPKTAPAKPLRQARKEHGGSFVTCTL